MEKNIDLLTRKIYDEGIEKANIEAEKIIDDARQKANSIIEKAKKEGENIVNDAQAESDSIKKNALSEIKLGGQQAVSSLKQAIERMISGKILDENIKLSFHDPAFVKQMIIEVVKAWHKDQSVAISLPGNLKKQAGQAFEQSLAKEIGNLVINFDGKLKGGFKVAQKNGGYQIVFTDEDFIEFFKPFLKEKTQEILFN